MPPKRALPASRPPLARMLRIHEELQDGRLTNCSKLADKLEVSTKTIMRDLAFMRDQLDLPAEYDPQTYSWRYAYPVESFPTVQVTEGELLALLVAQKALEQYQGTPYHGQLAHAFDKLSSGLHDRVTFSASGSLSAVSFHNLGLGRADLRLFDKLSRSVLQSKEVEFAYRKHGSPHPEQRRVQPYHLANRENSWYLVGFDLDRGALRHFAVSRMQSLAVTTRTFERPADFSPEKHFRNAFGAFVGSGNYKVRVRFSAEAAGQIRERFWHESQETTDLPDGRIDFSVRLDNLNEIRRWVLGWGPAAEVLEPAELRDTIRDAVAATRELYAPRTRGKG